MSTKRTDGCFRRAEDDEPLFTLLARDPLAPAAVRDWAERAERNGWQPAERIAEARGCADAMDAWRREHRPEKAEYQAPELPALLARGVAAWRRKANPATAWYSGSIDERAEAIVWLGCSWEAGGDAFCGACIGLARVLPEEGS